MAQDLQHYDVEGRDESTGRSFRVSVSPSSEFYPSVDENSPELYVEVKCPDSDYDLSWWDLQDSEQEGLRHWLENLGILLAAYNDTIRLIIESTSDVEVTDGIFVRIEVYNDDEEEEERELVELSMQEYRMRPANREVVEALEKVAIRALEMELRCAICLEGFSSGCETTKMPCAHVFHGDCIVRWLENQCFCPLCRFELPYDED